VAELTSRVDVAAPPEVVWDRLVDWDRQGEWMLGTTVRSTTNGGRGVGGGLEGWTGVGRLGFLDTMTITVWEPGRRCVVRHTGWLVRGGGAMEVEDLGNGRARFVWSEWLDLPLGRLGRLGWPLVRPLMQAGVDLSLRRFARWVEAG
jgi:uncharacterized protein YndB with AHSA1/START domain